MPKKPPMMSLSRDEDLFLRHWIHDEAHYREGVGSAKWLQLQHQATPADLAILIAAAIPDPIDQEEAGLGPPPIELPTWPWSEESWGRRLSEARAVLAGMASEPVAEPIARLRQAHTAGR